MATPMVEVVEIVGEQQNQSSPGRRGAVGERQSNHESTEEHAEEPDRNVNKQLRLVIRSVIGVVLFFVVLSCLAFSKLTLVTLADKLRHVTVKKSQKEVENKANIAQIYWQLLIIMMLPHLLTFLRSAFVGVLGKTNTAYPWPRRNALLAGAISSVLEVVAMSVFVFCVLCYLTPDLALLSMQPVFAAQFLLDIWYTPSTCRVRNQHNRQGSYSDLDTPQIQPHVEHSEDDEEPRTETTLEKIISRLRYFFGLILKNKITKTAAFLLQVVGTGGIIVIIVLKKEPHKDYLVPVIALPLSLITLSVLWTNKFQEFLSAPTQKLTPERDNVVTARYKANFLNSLYRIILYPLVAYGVFRLIHLANGISINPWTESRQHFLGTGSDLTFFLTHILTSFFGYVFAWTACLMTLRVIGFALPLLLSTPLAVILCLCEKYFLHEFPETNFLKDHDFYFSVILGIWFLLIYLGQILGIAYFLCTKNNLILSEDQDMFLNPHYESVFLEQYLSLNRQVNKYSNLTQVTIDGQLSDPRTIFICSTMYRENVREMRQMLKSIKRMSEWYDDQQRWKANRVKDLVESHIFFDGAVNGGQLTQYPLQLLSLVSDCLGVEVTRCIRKETHYGQSMSWDVGLQSMKFTVHFKDNLKVKNKKRWSQVMYMNYIINYRIPESQSNEQRKCLDKDNTFILTTDADIDFTAESAMVLLDSLASNKEVGAVCARTHPKGSGVLYWYQIFDYAIGHWFIKPAEHLFGSVLCCPGCFSVFRCGALEQVLQDYSSEVQGAADFLTKDMGEDRWLCTLLIQKGWRLDYCAISKDHTYCPETFDEFYKQRRRWVPSTIANLLLLISKARNITSANNSISLPFIIFQIIMAFSTAISPATVILIIASGLQGAYQISNGAVIATIVILSLLCVIYGAVCLYTSQKTQIDVAKTLTFLFAIVMAVVTVGIFKEIILEVFPVNNEQHLLRPPICRNASDTRCLIAQNNLGVALNMSTPFKSVQLPKNPTTWYLIIFIVTFIGAALLHLREATNLAHGVWYLLGLPSGYMLLLIYSAVNLDSQSWGTREAASKPGGGGGGFSMVKKWFREGAIGAHEILRLCRGKKEQDYRTEQIEPLLQEEAESGSEDTTEPSEAYTHVEVEHKEMTEPAIDWLTEHECLEYKDQFEKEGYYNLSYIASMGRKEFEAIGIEKQGFVLRLEKAAKKLPALVIETDVPATVTDWLKTLGMEEYTEVFHRAGYKTGADVENLKEIDEQELKRMGIIKMAHVKRLKDALNSIFHPTAVEIQIHKTKRSLCNIPAVSQHDEEAKFWKKILSKELKPVTVRLQQASKEIGQKLKTLRNSTLALIFLINVMWLILLYTVTLPQLVEYDLPERAFTLLFLAVYGVIILVSTVAMLMHRFLMLIHFLGRPEVLKEAIHTTHEGIIHLETADQL